MIHCCHSVLLSLVRTNDLYSVDELVLIKCTVGMYAGTMTRLEPRSPYDDSDNEDDDYEDEYYRPRQEYD